MKQSRLVIIIMCLTLFSLDIVYSQTATITPSEITFKVSDFNPYFSSYFEPFARGMAVGMGGGWYNTAKVHSFLGFDISLVSISLAQIPDADKTFTLMQSDLPGYGLVAANGNSSFGSDLPTLNAGDEIASPALTKTIEPTYTVTDPNGNVIDQGSFPAQTETIFDEMPAGQGLGYSGALNMLQIGFGLPKGITIKARYLPEIDVDPLDLSASLWGVGLQHDILQWIPLAKKVPFLQASVVGGYTKFTGSYGGSPFPIDPSTFSDKFSSSVPSSTWEDQSFDLEASALSGGLVIGASLPVVHPYVGLNYNKSSFTGGLRGNFPVAKIEPEDIDPNNPQFEGFKYSISGGDMDPINIETDDTMIGFTGGLRVKLAVLTLWGQYTVQEYPMINAGLGISFR